MGRRWLIVAFAAAVGGCSLFTSLSGFSDGNPATTNEAGADVETDATAGDSATDAPTGDGSVNGRYCATTDASFCDDFDDGGTTFPNWTIDTDPGGTVAKGDGGYSPPSSLEVTTSATTTENTTALVAKAFGTHARTRVAYRFIILDHDPGGSALRFSQIDCDPGTGAMASVRLNVAQTIARFEGVVYTTPNTGTFPDVSPQLPLDLGAWHSVDMLIDWAASPSTVTIDFDGMRVSDKRQIPGATFGAGAVTVHAGIEYSEAASGPWRVRVDDVAVWNE